MLDRASPLSKNSKRNKRLRGFVGQQQPSNVQALAFSATSYSGPLPPAAELREYDLIHPGLADRIVGQWERQTTHRQDLERIVVNSNVGHARVGQWLAFLLALAGMAIAGLLIYTGHSVKGFSLVVGELVGLAGLFLYQRRRQEHELATKRQALQQSAPHLIQ